jgi:hypothetical protein
MWRRVLKRFFSYVFDFWNFNICPPVKLEMNCVREWPVTLCVHYFFHFFFPYSVFEQKNNLPHTHTLCNRSYSGVNNFSLAVVSIMLILSCWHCVGTLFIFFFLCHLCLFFFWPHHLPPKTSFWRPTLFLHQLLLFWWFLFFFARKKYIVHTGFYDKMPLLT